MSTPVSRRATFLTPLLLLAPRAGLARAGAMTLCMHTNTSSGAGYRGALEGWAKAGIKYVEINGAVVDEFLKTDTIGAARSILSDNGLTAVHGTAGQFGLIEPNDKHAGALETLKKRLEMFSALGVKKVYTTSTGGPKLALEDYAVVARQARAVGEVTRTFDMIFSVEFVRTSQYMSTLLTALKVAREAAHPNFGVMFDFYHFWSGNNKLEDMDQIGPGEIQHVHFQDVPDIPRELFDNNTRVIPGDGVAPVIPMLRKLADKGYAGPLSVELFIPRFRDGSAYEAAREIKTKCEAVMARAGVA